MKRKLIFSFLCCDQTQKWHVAVGTESCELSRLISRLYAVVTLLHFIMYITSESSENQVLGSTCGMM